MKKIFGIALFFLSTCLFAAEQSEPCTHGGSIVTSICKRLHLIWKQGKTELYLSGYAWHNRYTYSQEKIDSYNEAAYGTGLGKGYFDERGNWQGLYAYAFLDSHKNVEPVVGYAYLKVFPIHHEFKAGIGYTLLVTARPDINHNIPFPGALPWASLFYKKVTLAATYIPGFNNNGNVLYLVGKYTFDS
jgi:palmitoyl transferase